MKSNIIKRVVAVFLCLVMGLSLMSVSFTASAYHFDDDTIHSYDDLNCAEDDCDCLEPDENVFKVVSPVSGSSVNTDYADVVFTGPYHEVQDYYKENGQTDGMPVIPPTTFKVEKFMRYIPEADTDVIATVASTGRVITAYEVAVNAVMSGCSAEYMPICIAFVKAMNDTEYVSSLADGKLTPMAFVNGPLARQLGIDNQQGMTTEEANIAIGRFIEFSLINLAGIKRSTSFGYMQPLVFSENDKACLDIGWKPYNVQQGFDLNESTVTATSFAMWGNNVTPATDLPEQIMKVIAWDITEKELGGLGSADSETYADTHRVVFVTPQVASALSTLYKDKENLEDALITAARRPMWMRAYAYYYANTGVNLTGKSLNDVYDELLKTEAEDARLTASPDWLIGITEPTIQTGATMAKGNTIFLVTGDDSRNKTQVMPGGVSVTVKAEVSDMYESLVTSMNYQPVENYYLAENNLIVTPPASVTSVLTNGTYRILDPSSGSTYLTREGRVYFDSSTNTLYYYAVGASAKASVKLDETADASFIAYLENLGPNSSFRVYNGKLKDATIRFSSNASKPDTNTVALTAESFEGIALTLHANNTENSLAAGGIANDGSTVTISSDITSFAVNLDGDIVMGEATSDGFVTLNGTNVALNPDVPAGSKAIIGTENSDGTYRTMTFEAKGDGTYKITYNTANTLSLEDSAIHLKGTFNNWESKDAFKKTDSEDVYTLTKAFEAGTYTFKIDANGTWYGNKGTFTDSALRWEMSTSVSENCTFKATGGTYTFTWDNAAKRLTVSKGSDELPEIPEVTTKTVYVGVIEYIKDFVPTLHYWNNSTGLAGDATLTATGETVKYSVGSAYWNNSAQKFNVYKTTIPAEAVAMKTWDKSSNGKWAAEEVTYAEDKILLLFEWSNVYHNVTGSYIVEEPTEPTTAPTETTVPEVTETTVPEVTEATPTVTYKVTFVDYDGAVLYEQVVKEGESATAPEAPSRQGDAQYSYSFEKWDTDFSAVNSDLTVTAVYTQTVKKYTVTFIDGDGTVYSEQEVEYGLSATAPADPEKEGFTFAGWDTDFSEIKSNIFVYALWEIVETPMYFEVSWDASDVYSVETELDAVAVLEGTDFTFKVAVAEGYNLDAVVVDMKMLTADENGVYTISEISKDTKIIVVTTKKTVVPETMQFTVTFADKDGNTISEQKVKYGMSAVAPEAPVIDGYNFTGWSEDFSFVTKDLVVKAKYSKITTPSTTGKLQIEITGGTSFTISIDGGAARPQGTSYYNTKAPKNVAVTVVASTTNGNEFVGWMNAAGAIVSTTETYTFNTSGDDFLKAVYQSKVEGVNVVIFKNDKAAGGNGQILDMQYYAAGDEIVFPGAPAHAGYDFAGWAMTAEEIQAELAAGKDVTVVANWTRAIKLVNITVEGGTYNGATEGQHQAYTSATVVADAAADGMKFAYWTNAAGQVVSYDAEYSFFPAEDVALKANYVATDAAIEYKALASLAADPTVAGEKIQYTLSWDVPAEVGTFVSVGLMVVDAADYNADTFYHGSGDSKIFDRATSVTVAKGSTGITKSSSLYDHTYYACTFVVYKDAQTGENVTIHSEMITVEKLAD